MPVLHKCRSAVFFGCAVLLGIAAVEPWEPVFSTSARTMDYYVSPKGNDQNDGSKTHPLATLTRAASRARPGTTIHVLPGSYKEMSSGKNSDLQDLLTTTSGTARAHIRYISDELWNAKIVGSGRPRTAVWKNTGDYVDIIGFEIIGGPGTTDGILLTGANDSVMGNKVHDIPVPGNNFPNGGSGISSTIHYTTAVGNKAIGNIVYNIGSDSVRNAALVHGIYWGTPLGVIQNNVVYKVQGFCIFLNHNPTENVVTNNTVFNCGTLQGDRRYGGGIGIASQGFTPVDHITVNNNIIVDCPGRYAIQERYTGGGSLGPHNLFRNNLVFRNAANFDVLLSQPPSGTITDDPLFVKYHPDGSGDYRLKHNSPATGAGTTACASVAQVCVPLKDILGIPKHWPGVERSPARAQPYPGHQVNSGSTGATPMGSASIGAYEQQSPASKWPWY